MNYLAHALLSPDDEKVFLGNFSGDFVKGAKNPGLHPNVWLGVQLHRKIDTFTDTHPLVLMSKNAFPSETRRYAGIILDVLYDYFLSKNWPKFCSMDRQKFIQSKYNLLQSMVFELPENFQPISNRIIQYDWLSGYSSLDKIEVTLQSISRRFQARTGRVNPISESLKGLKNQLTNFENIFSDFFPELQREVANWRILHKFN